MWDSALASFEQSNITYLQEGSYGCAMGGLLGAILKGCSEDLLKAIQRVCGGIFLESDWQPFRGSLERPFGVSMEGLVGDTL